jgi:DNA-binding transcriptional LysR family regulator
LVPRLHAGEVDLALIYEHDALAQLGTGELDRTPLLDDVFQAVLPAGHPLARERRPVELRELRGDTWIGGAPNSPWYRITTDACRRAGFEPEAGFASDDYLAVQALVAAGLGVSVIPGLAVTHPLPGVEVRLLASGAPVRRICAARPRDGYNGPAVTAMIDCLKAAAGSVTVGARPA